MRFNLGNGGDTVNISGDFSATSLSANTITVVGGNGNDTVNASGLTSADDIVFTGGSGDDTFSGGPGADTFSGGAGNDTVNYVLGGGADSIDGGADTDTLNVLGTAGDDTIAVSLDINSKITTIAGETPTSIENFTANGLGGSDTLNYSGNVEAVTVNLATLQATGFASIASIENATGGSGDDVLTGNADVNVLTGNGGADTLTGTGNDTLAGGTGNDVYYAHASDTVTEDSAQASTKCARPTATRCPPMSRT